MNFYQQVYQIVKKIPKGRVATYGQIAGLISTPKAARVVGFALRLLLASLAWRQGRRRSGPVNIPWQRVINCRGIISIENLDCPKELQAQLLKKEGITVTFKQGNYWVDLNKYLWQPKKR